MKILPANKEGTVGVVSNVDGLQHIGTFSVALLKEWLDNIGETFDNIEEVHLFVKKSNMCEAHGLLASFDGDDPLVVVLGKHPADGKEWGKMGAEKTG